jgi:hypothetical protein
MGKGEMPSEVLPFESNTGWEDGGFQPIAVDCPAELVAAKNATMALAVTIAILAVEDAGIATHLTSSAPWACSPRDLTERGKTY